MGTIILMALFVVSLSMVDKADVVGEQGQGLRYWALLILGVSGVNFCVFGLVFIWWMW